MSKIHYCRNCGNRYSSHGWGWLGEFCSDGCQRRYEELNPGYARTARRKSRFRKLIKFLIIIGIIAIIVWIV